MYVAVGLFVRIVMKLGKITHFQRKYGVLNRIAILGMIAAAAWFIAFIVVVTLDRLSLDMWCCLWSQSRLALPYR